ncbi:MAG: hypothetical protein KIT72_12440 [Polyangiaceae bacterium]|nr:hypothetical protein [Polyangiaceae bacterium]MCW5791222.1 hypothetical protein [Polyangiaceae bacterium]
MALPATLLARLPRSVYLAQPGGSDAALPGVRASVLRPNERAARPLGLPLDAWLPDGGFPAGAVVELAQSGVALGTSVALAACREAQRPRGSEAARGLEALQGLKALQGSEALQGAAGERAWCAFVDPTASLFAPAVARSGVSLDRLLVVQPQVEAVHRAAVKLVESQVFSLVVVDWVGTAAQPLDIPLGGLGRVVRRLALAAERGDTTVLLLTDASTTRRAPLPVAQRFELRQRAGVVSVKLEKDRYGRQVGAQGTGSALVRARALLSGGADEELEVTDERRSA